MSTNHCIITSFANKHIQIETSIFVQGGTINRNDKVRNTVILNRLSNKISEHISIHVYKRAALRIFICVVTPQWPVDYENAIAIAINRNRRAPQR